MELFQRIETLIGKKLPAFPTQEEEVMMLVERVSEAQRFARLVSVHKCPEVTGCLRTQGDQEYCIPWFYCVCVTKNIASEN